MDTLKDTNKGRKTENVETILDSFSVGEEIEKTVYAGVVFKHIFIFICVSVRG